MVGDRAHAHLLQNGWTWNGETLYVRDLLGGAGSMKLVSNHDILEDHCVDKNCQRFVMKTQEAKIWHQRINEWVFFVMDQETKWHRVCIHEDFNSAARAVLGTRY